MVTSNVSTASKNLCTSNQSNQKQKPKTKEKGTPIVVGFHLGALMKLLKVKVEELLASRNFTTSKYLSRKDCQVQEESDMYGFSLISECTEQGTNIAGGRKDLLVSLKRDQNWNNPGSVCLMCKAYQIDDQFDSIIFGNTLRNVGKTYLEVKDQQHLMFAEKYYAEGVAFKGRGLALESIKPLSDALLYNSNHTNARIERADAYFKSNKKEEALDDYMAIVAAQPKNAVALERLMLLRNNTSFAPLFTPSSGSAGSSSRIHVTDYNSNYNPAGSASASFPSSSMLSDNNNKNVFAKPLVFKSNGLISKLQQSLLDNPNYLDTSSDSESSRSSSSDDTEKNSCTEEKRSKKRDRKESKDKRSEGGSSKKKRKTKHKKDKHSKKKKKHKSDK